jgi:hypothetical protein
LFLFLLISHSFLSLSQTHLGIINPASPSARMVSSTPHHLPTPSCQNNHLRCPSLELNCRPTFHVTNSPSESGGGKVTAQEGGYATPAMNEVLPGTITKDRGVCQQAKAPVCANSEPVSNDIDESDLQYEK